MIFRKTPNTLRACVLCGAMPGRYPPEISSKSGGSQSSTRRPSSEVEDVSTERGSCLTKDQALAFLALGPDTSQPHRSEDGTSSSDGGRGSVKDLRDRARRDSCDFQVPPFIRTRRQCSMFPLSCWKP
eukprot:s137_g13.t1